MGRMMNVFFIIKFLNYVSAISHQNNFTTTVSSSALWGAVAVTICKFIVTLKLHTSHNPQHLHCLDTQKLCWRRQRNVMKAHKHTHPLLSNFFRQKIFFLSWFSSSCAITNSSREGGEKINQLSRFSLRPLRSRCCQMKNAWLILLKIIHFAL